MLDPRKIEQFARRVQAALPQGVRDIGGEIDKKIRQVLHAQLSTLDLVDRQTFDTQSQLLLCTREKLIQLEQRVAHLERRLVEQAEKISA